MDINKYIPNIFAQSAPSYIQGLLGAEETRNLQNRANVQGLLGAGLALAQGMSRTGPRRSAAENVLGALAGGFGAAGGAYDQGVRNYMTQQQIAQTQLAQQDALLKRQQTMARVRAIEQASKDNPQLAQLFAINPEEASKQLLLQRRAERYQSLLGETPPISQQVPMAGQVDVSPVANVNQAIAPSANLSTVSQQPVTSNTTTPAPSGQANQNVQLVDPAAAQKANGYRNAAKLATLEGDIPTANFYNAEANRIDPPEAITFRDGMAFSSKRGILGRFTEYKRLTKEEVQAEGLSPNKVWQKGPDNRIYALEGSDSTSELNKKQLIESLPTQALNVYSTLKPRFDALVKRAPGLTADQINSEIVSILDADSKILAELDPKLRAAELEKRRASKTDVKVYTGELSKTTAGQVEQGALSDAAAITRLNNIQFSYKPQYQNIKFRTGQAWNTLRDKFVDLPEAEKRQLAEYSQYKQNSLQNLNQTIKDITGAAMGVQEAERIIASLPNAGTDIFGGDSPTEFEAKLNNAVKQTKYALARKNYALKKGLNWENTPLDSMPSIINKRGKEIAEQYKLDLKKPADLQIIDRQLAAEFGIAF